MSGHSKWANIKHRKGSQDAKRSKIFSRIIKEISVATKSGGTELISNPRLRTALQNAKGVNMPKDTIERAIKKASGSNAETYEEVTFEGYAPHGIAVFIECTTDNNNRTVANIRSVFSKNGGALGKNGSLEFIFERKGVFKIINIPGLNVEKFEMDLIDSGLELMKENGDIITIYTDFSDFDNMQKKLEEMEINILSSKLERIPKDTKELDLDKSESIIKMIDLFEEDEDVQNVFHNLKISTNLKNIT